MKEIKLSAKRLIPAALLCAMALYLLGMCWFFPVSGDDWFFTTRQEKSLPDAVSQGVRVAAQHYETTNGRILGNFLSGMLGCSRALRTLVRACVILGVFFSVIRLCGVQSHMGRLCAFTLLVALPSGLFAESYAWAAGFFNYVPPVLLLLVYLISAEKRGKRGSALCVLGQFLLGFASQLFSEHVTVIVLLLSGAVCIRAAVREKRIDCRLAAHLLGCLLGALVMFLAPGYHSAASAGYRSVSLGVAALAATFATNFPLMVRTLLENNWLVVLPLSVCSAVLLLRAAPTGGAWCKARMASLAAIAVSPVFFWCDGHILAQMQYNRHVQILSLALSCLFSFAYLAALAVTAALCLKGGERRKALALLALAVLFAAPFFVVKPVGARCLYLSDVLAICVTLLLAKEVFMLWPPAGKALSPALDLCALALLAAMLWIAFWNGRTQLLRDQAAQAQMAQGAAQIILPDFAYPEYVHEGSSEKIGHYYRGFGEVSFDFVPFGAWEEERPTGNS